MSIHVKPDAFVAAKHAAANAALEGLTDRQRAHYALALISGINDPDAVAALRFMAIQIGDICNILIREAYEREGV